MKKIYLLITIIFFLLFNCQIQAQNIMKLGDVSVQAGQEATLVISVDNTQPFVAFQVDIPIPNGLTYIESSAVLEDARKDGHILSASIVSSNTLRLIGYSLSSIPFKGNSGAVMHFKLKAGQLPGNYSLVLTNPIIGDATSANILSSSTNGKVMILSPHIQLSVASIDFGRVALGQTLDRNITINNTGNQLLQVTGITFTNPQFTTIGGSSFSLDANGSKNIGVRFTSQTKGTYKETMSIASNDPALPVAIDTLKAVAFAVNELHSGSITALSGETKTLDFTINNMEAFTAFQFDIPLPTTMQYVIGSAILLRKQDHQVSCSMINSNTLRVVAFSASNKAFTGTDGKVLSLDFKIAGQAGWYPINISNGIISDAAGLNAMSASYNGSLQVSAAQISAVQQLSFGDVSILSSKTLSLRVSNTGGDVLNIDQLLFSDPSFSSTQSLPLAIPIGQYADIPVIFSKNSKGAVSATLKINSNDPVTNPFTVNLSVNAFIPNYIYVKDFNGCVGTDVVVTIDVDNEEDFVALQCDLKYPSYLTPKTSEIVLTDRKGDHALQSNLLGNNTIRLVAFSMTQQAFKGKTGAVINIPFSISAGAVTGSYPLEISNGIMGNASSQNILYGTKNGTITVNDIPSAAGTITGNAAVCKGGTETYTVPAITGATSYLWTLPTGITGTSQTNSITVTIGTTAISGSIKVKGHNGCGDGTESALAITVNDIPSAAGAIIGNTTAYKGTNETYTVPAITGATLYIWTLPTGVTGTSTTNSITVTISSMAVSGNIKVKGRNGCGDGAENSLAITINDITAGVITGNTYVCKGSTETYTVGTIAGATSYIWTLPTGASGTSSTNMISVTFSSSATSGSIKVKGHNNGGDGTESALAITVNDIPSASGAITGNATVCKSGTETYTVPSITGATSYLWTLPTGITGTSTTNSITVTIGTTAVSGSIKVKGRNDCGDGNESSIAITANTFGLNYLNVKEYNGCSGTDIIVTLDVENGLPFVALQCDLKYPSYLTPKTSNIVLTDRAKDHTIQTSLPGNNILRVIAFSLTQQEFKGKTGAVVQIPFTVNSDAIAGSYALELSNVILGNSQSQNIIDNFYNGTIVINTLPTAAGVISGSTTVCKGITEIYSIPAVSGATSYIWTLPTGLTGSSSSNSIAITISNSATSGSIKVKGHNDCGDGMENNLAITVNDIPSDAGNITGNATVCKGSVETFSVPVISGATSYIWTLPEGITGTSTTNSILVAISNTAISGSINVKGRNDCGDGTMSTLSLTVDNIPFAASSISGNITVCKGATETYNIPAIAGASTYLWTLPGGITGTSTTNTITVAVSNTATSGSIKVKGHNDCGDGTESSLAIIVNEVPSTAGVITGNAIVCKGLTETYSLPFIAGANTYIWTLPTGMTGTSSTNAITVTIGNTATSGSIKVKGHNDCGDGTESSLAITVNDVPISAGTITGNILICKGSTETYTVPSIAGATSYIWTLPAGITGTSATNTITATIDNTATSGSLKVKGRNDCGDGALSTLNLTINEKPLAAGTLTGSNVVCKISTGTYSVPAIAGANSYIWTLPSGASGNSTSNTIFVTFNNSAQSGSINVKGHNDCGDGTESSLAITVNDVPSTAGTITGNATALKGTTETYTVPAITGATSYIWTLPSGVTGTSSTNSITATISNNAVSGNIKVKGHNGCGDGVESILAITVNEAGKNNLTVKGTTGCSGTDVMVTLEVDNGLPFIALQCDLKYPAYLTPKMSNITLTDRATDHNIQTSLPVANTLRVLAYSLSLQAFKGKTGAVVQIPFTINTNALAGSYPLELSNVTLGNSQSQNIIDNSYNGALVISTGPSIAGAITGNATVCKGVSEIYTVPVISGATSYIWTLPTGVTGTSNTNTINVNYSNTATSGNIKVKGHNDCGDGTESSFAVTVNAFPVAAGVITGNTNICQETTNITYSVPAITGATSYIWTLPTGASGTSSTNTISLNFGRTAVSGNLKVKGNNACGDGAEASLAITVCLGVGIEDAAITNKVGIYPNPTLNEFYVTINKPFKNDFKVEVCNNFGQVVQTILKNKNDNKFSVDLTNYPTGLYFVRFSDKETHFHCKIIKQ